jgi:hypothetical protein
VVDIAELVGVKGDELGWESLMSNASRLGAERVVALGLFLAHNLAGARLPGDVLRRVQSDPAVRPIAAQVTDWMLGEARSSLPTSDWCRYHLSVKERWREKVRLRLHYLRRYAQLAVVPNEKDIEFFRLPGALSIFYYVLRPVRLIREYGIKKVVSALSKLF